MTKKQQALWEQYKRATKKTLDECYVCASKEKREAYEEIQMKRFFMEGWRTRITSHNTFQFSMAFLYKKDGKNMLHYETRSNVWDFEVPADQL